MDCHGDVVKSLLSSGKINPIAKNRNNQTAMELVYRDVKDRFRILKMFEPFDQCRKDFPVESYSKVFFCGNTGAGKSSLAAVIMERANKPPNYKFDTSDPIAVELLTTGINAHTITSHEVGNIVLYDLAGHKEYYSSHAAILENLMLRTPAVFAILSKMTNNLDVIKGDLYYWFNFIKNASLQLSRPSQILVIGSRLDEIGDDYKKISKLVAEVAAKADHSQEYRGFLHMECHRPGGKGVKEFVAMLSYSCKAVLDQSDKISFYCHVQFSFLQLLRNEENTIAISLKELCDVLQKHDDPSLPSDRSVLLEFLTILSDKGLILFLKNEDDAQSWVVIDRAALITEVNGVLFAPKEIQRAHQNIASNTGIVPKSILQKLFPKHNTHMLIGFLRSLQFCHVLESNTLQQFKTNISTSIPLPSDEVLFFPSLIYTEPPTDIAIENGLGWCLWCPDPNQFLSTRFLHLLLFGLSYSFCLQRRYKAGKIGDGNQEIQSLACCCDVWTNGIYWKRDEIKVIVEVTENYRCVTVVTSMNDVTRSRKFLNNVIKSILKLSEMHAFKYEEYLIAPSDIAKARSLVIERTLYNIKDIARSVLLKCKVSDDNDTKEVGIEEIVGVDDPFLCIAPSVTKALFNPELPLREDLQHIVNRCSHFSSSLLSSSHMSIKERCSERSVFAGRNPLVSINQFEYTCTRNLLTICHASYFHHINFVLYHTYTTLYCIFIHSVIGPCLSSIK